MNPNRRRILQALGLTTGSLLLPSRGFSSVNGTPARRIIFFVSSHGTEYVNWKMRPNGEPDDQDWEASLTSLGASDWSPILAPLSSHASKLLILDGIGHGPAMMSRSNGHQAGHATCLTGQLPVVLEGSNSISSSPSLDQLLGERGHAC